MADARLPCRLLDRHAKGKVPIADDELRGERYCRDNGNGGVSTTHAIKLDLRKRADVGGILYIAHFSLHPLYSGGPFRHRRGDFCRKQIAGDVKKLTLAV
jgi:hypothetical protein